MTLKTFHPVPDGVEHRRAASTASGKHAPRAPSSPMVPVAPAVGAGAEPRRWAGRHVKPWVAASSTAACAAGFRTPFGELLERAQPSPHGPRTAADAKPPGRMRRNM